MVKKSHVNGIRIVDMRYGNGRRGDGPRSRDGDGDRRREDNGHDGDRRLTTPSLCKWVLS
jgi:hypothetical protein